jgi:hypothetical protein
MAEFEHRVLALSAQSTRHRRSDEGDETDRKPAFPSGMIHLPPPIL